MTKEERAAKWDAEFIPCKKHPKKRCSKNRYICRSHRICGACVYNYPSRKRSRLRRKKSGKAYACSRRYVISPKGKLTVERYHLTDRYKAAVSRANHSEAALNNKAWYIEKKLHGDGRGY